MNNKIISNKIDSIFKLSECGMLLQTNTSLLCDDNWVVVEEIHESNIVEVECVVIELIELIEDINISKRNNMVNIIMNSQINFISE